MNIDDVMPNNSKFINAADLRNQSVPVTITHVAIEVMRDGSSKPVLYFAGKEKGLTLNVTNKNVLKSLFGSETENWVGKQIILFPMMVEFQGEMKQGVRMRAPEGPVQQPAQQDNGYRSSPGTQQPAAQPAPQGPPAGHPANLDDEVPF